MENLSICYDSLPQIITEVFKSCYVHEESSSGKTIKVEGLNGDVYFDKEILETYRETIISCISLIPTEFFSGYGWTFANIGLTRKDYKEWTTKICVKEKLFLLAMGLNLMKYSFPRKDWNDLYEKLPYVKVCF